MSGVERTAQLGTMQATISVANISGGLSATAGPLSASVGANVSASLTREQLSNAAAGVTITANAGYVEGSASARISPVGASLSFGGGAYLAEATADKRIAIGNYNVNLYAEGGVGVSAEASASIGLVDSAHVGVGPIEVGVSLSPN